MLLGVRVVSMQKITFSALLSLALQLLKVFLTYYLEIQILLVVVWSRFFGRMNSDRKSGFFGTMILSPFQLFSTRPLLFDYSRVPNNRVVRIKRE